MYSTRLSLITVFMLLCAVAAAAQAGSARPGSGSSAAQVLSAPEEGGPRNWEVTGVSRALNLREQPSNKARIVARYAPARFSTTWDAGAPMAKSGATSSNWAEARAAMFPRNF